MATTTGQWIEVLGEDVELPLVAFDLSHAEERWQFLWRLSQIGEEGLFIATSHLWSALAPPRAACPTSAPLRRNGVVEERRISGSS